LCVYTSVWHSAQWQNVAVLDGYRRWMERRPGGGYPSKVDQTLAAYCRELGRPVPGYVQHTGGDDTFLDLAIRTDRCPAVTYDGRDDFYRGPVAHMVNLAHLDRDRAAILDNNRPGSWVWMSRADFLARWRGTGGGWAIVLLEAPPPPYTSAPAAEPVLVGQCGPDGCRVDPAPIGSAPSEAHEWGRFPDGRWGWRLKPASPVPPGGVVPERVHDHPEYSICGRPATRAEAHAAVAAGNLADDTDHWHLTAVGDAALCDRVRADVAALPAEVRSKIHLQCYQPDAWPVAQFGLPAGVSLRAPSPGRVAPQLGACGAAEYLASPAKLAELLSLPGGPLPKPKPADPPAPAPAPFKLPQAAGAWLAVGILVFLLLRR
jgi:hypothetical protein